MARPPTEQSAIETPGNLSLLFRALANEYRRAVVRSLDATHTPIPRDALATYVAKEVFSERQRSDFIAFRDRALVKLRHVHLPMLANAGIIEVEAGQITPGDMYTVAVALLEEIP